MSADKYDARSTARLLAVQALYQMDIAHTPIEEIISEFAAHRIDDPLDSPVDGPLGGRPSIPLDSVSMPPADIDYFEFILRGVMDNQIAIDRMIDGYLMKNWSLARLDSTLRAILRCGVRELLKDDGVPAGVIASEYTDIAHAFFDGPEGGMANALLDRVARAIACGMDNQMDNQETDFASDGG